MGDVRDRALLVMTMSSGDVTPVFVMEDHDEAYYRWKREGYGQTILHIDAHHDMWWRGERDPITVANFLCPAIREGIVSSVIWVVPGPSLESKAGHRSILRFLKQLAADYPNSESPHREENGYVLQLAGVLVQVRAIEHLPASPGPVLLDIDVDYFLIPEVRYGDWDHHAELPWSWPEELLATLAARHVQPTTATVAYSVNGGYTPLRWKFLGDELAARLRGDSAETALYSRLREGALAEHRGDLEAAERLYRDAAMSRNAAAQFRLAWLYAGRGNSEEAHACYRSAVQLDPSYSGPHASRGFALQLAGRPQEGEREHRQMLLLDPHNANAICGIGFAELHKDHAAAAAEGFREALASDHDLLDAWRGLGHALVQLGRRDEARQAYEKYLSLSLRGARPVCGICASAPGSTLLDPNLGEVHAAMGDIRRDAGKLEKAIAHYRMSLASQESARVRRRLERLTAKKGSSRSSPN